MFFYPPSVALEKTNNGSFYLAVALGSGWRAHPLDTVVQDRFYVLRQPLGAPSTYTKYTESSLYDATSNDAGSTNTTTQTTALQSLASTQGWYIRFTNSGEKVMGESLIANNQIMFTTYKPSASSANACGGGSLGTGSFYVLSIFDATPTIKLNSSSTNSVVAADASNRSKDLTRGGIPPSPVLYFPPGGAAPVVLVGPEKQPSGVTSTLLRTYWVERKQ
jgi:type IV pilus assembly protein PilY1